MATQQANIQSREELFGLLGRRMNRSYEQLRDRGEVEGGSNYVKTFLIEFDWKPQNLEKKETEFLEDSLTIPAVGKRKTSYNASVLETEEKGFYVVEWLRSGREEQNALKLYIDTITDKNRRFWRVYSLSDASETDNLLERLSVSQTRFDRVWFWSDLLKSTQEKGEFRGFGLDYDHTYFELAEGEINPSNFFKVRVSGGNETSAVLDAIYNQEELVAKSFLSKVRMKYLSNPERKDQFSIESIYHNGKFTTNGTSFWAHQRLVDQLQQDYAQTIYRIENDHTIQVGMGEQGLSVAGDPIIFYFDKSPIANLDKFCEVVFSGRPPFRLWGIPRPVAGSSEGLTVQAVDMHNGSKIFFELYSDIICMYLHPGTCGNTAARFFTNIQRTFSRIVSAQNNAGNSVF